MKPIPIGSPVCGENRMEKCPILRADELQRIYVQISCRYKKSTFLWREGTKGKINLNEQTRNCRVAREGEND